MTTRFVESDETDIVPATVVEAHLLELLKTQREDIALAIEAERDAAQPRPYLSRSDTSIDTGLTRAAEIVRGGTR